MDKKFFIKSKKFSEDNRGLTLTEMVVTFALIGIFMASAVSVISSAVITHSELTASMYAQSVGEMLLDKVTGELAAARADEGRTIALGMVLEESAEDVYSDGVAFFDREGNPVVGTVEDGLLYFRYDDFDWALDPKAYMGFRITQMEIKKRNDKNILEVSFKIKNLKTGFEYSTSRCTMCYNFKTDEEWRRITEGNEISA
ncbi:MAG: prepilin-type N-terminal cleavage/methylation domain-containing protein [Lachnospiraceae bacterium]|nr:prepilin-type N-terminal cleavage/methylation domain-containing protein [Lachnospiraceae bacterium]